MKSEKIKNLIEITDLSIEEINSLIDVANSIMDSPEKYYERCKHKKLATLFFEPSTRTRLSFEAAMLDLGGSVLGFSEANSSSTAKGESVQDTTRIVGGYCDIIAMRHPTAYAPAKAAQVTTVPLINAGDGGHEHPTQTLADLFIIKRELGTLDNISIGFCGDLKYGRTVHSLIAAMLRYKNCSFYLISPSELALPDYVLDKIKEKGNSFKIIDKLENALPNLDVLYMTRVQKERFDDIEQYEMLKDYYILNNEKMKLAKEKMLVLHPLPRVNEIAEEVDSDSRAAYFRQAHGGKYIRMALILKLLDC